MRNLKGERVLVTGATGFIGSHLVQRLLAEGAVVRALSHYRGHPGLHNLEHVPPDERGAVEVVRGDVRDPFLMRECVKGCQVVFHLAALIAIPYSYQAPASYVATNVNGTLNILEACRAERTPRLVHTSTSETFGTAVYTPIDEKHPLQGQSPYSATKIGADKLVESYCCSFELPAVTLRPFNTYGPRQSARAVIPAIVAQILGGKKTLRLGSLTPVRDLTFVSDTVDGYVRAACAEGVTGEVINLGNGTGITIGDLAHRIIGLLGADLPVETDEQRVRPAKSEVMALICDNAKARRLLGWTPRVSLDEGLREVIGFVGQNLGQFRTDEYGV